MEIKLRVCSVDSLEGRQSFDLVVESFEDHFSEFDPWLFGGVFQVGKSVLHPGVIETVGEIVSGVSATGLLSVLSSVHGHLSLDHEVLKLHGLNQVGVPDVATVTDADIGKFLGCVMEHFAAHLEVILATEDSSVLLHSLLHRATDFRCGRGAGRVPQTVEVGDALFTSVGLEVTLGLARRVVFDSGLSTTASKDNQIEERVGTKTVSSVDRSASSLTASKEALDLDIVALSVLAEDLGAPVSRNTTHVVMDSGQDGDGLLGGIDTSEDMRGLENAGKALVDLLGLQMVQMKVDVILVGANTTALQDLHGHGAGDDITGCEILSCGSVPLHEALTLTVPEDTTFTAAALGHEATSAIDTSRMELNELRVLDGDTSPSHHTVTVTSASMSASAAEVGTAVTSSGNNSLVGLHTVNGTIGHVVGHDTAALTILHDEVHGEVLDEEDAIVAEGTTEQGVEH